MAESDTAERNLITVLKARDCEIARLQDSEGKTSGQWWKGLPPFDPLLIF